MMQDGNNLNVMIKAAKQRAKDTRKVFYVVYEYDHTGHYHVASDFDMDTWYAGTSDSNVLYCTAE